MKLLLTTQVIDPKHPILGFFIGWIEAFAEKFDEVHVICLQKGEYALPDNVYVYSLGKEEGENNLKYIYRFYTYFWHIFFHVRVTYVLFHMGAIYNVMAAPFFMVRKFYGTQFYWWKTHGHIDFVGRLALLFVDRVCTAIRESFPVETRKRVEVGHAIDTSLFAPGEEKQKPPVLLFVGRLSRSKHVEQVLEVTKKLQEKGISFQTRIIGTRADETYARELDAMVDELGISSLVTFVNGMPHADLVSEFQGATVFMNPSDNDGLDKVVLEAMVSGTAVLTANASFKRVLSEYGLFMERDNISQYTNKTIELLDMDSGTYTSLTEPLVGLVRREHALSTLADRIFNNK